MFNFLYSLISFFIALFFIALGLIGILLPWSAALRTDMIEFILANSVAISLFGFGFAIVGATIILNLVLSAKKKYYNSTIGPHFVTIDETVIAQYLQSYWEEKFPLYEVPSQVTVKRNKIRIKADLPYVASAEQQDTLNHIKQDLRELLTTILGYPQEFMLSVNFAKK